MIKKVSLKDIAQKVGVSIALVSYVLNNKKEGRISKEIAQKIKEAAAELNYRVNHIARSLKTNKTFTIGLVVADISNTFYSTLARIIEDEAGKSDYTVLFGSSDESAEKLEKLINVLLNQQVDGLIIAPVENATPQIQYLQRNEIPFVLIDRYFPEIKTNYVAIDNYKAAYITTRHLLATGRRNIGLVTYNTSLYHLNERKRGFTDALKDGKITFKKRWVEEVSIANNRKEVKTSVDRLLSLSQPADAILFAANNLSVEGLKYINTLAIRVPDELAIASFDQSDAAELFYAPLSYIKQPLAEMGHLATQILLQSISSNNKITQVNMEAPLVIGKSSAARVKNSAGSA